MLIRREESAAKLARRYGVSEPTLYSWRDKFIAGGVAALVGGKNGEMAEKRRLGPMSSAGWSPVESSLRRHESMPLLGLARFFRLG